MAYTGTEIALILTAGGTFLTSLTAAGLAVWNAIQIREVKVATNGMSHRINQFSKDEGHAEGEVIGQARGEMIGAARATELALTNNKANVAASPATKP